MMVQEVLVSVIVPNFNRAYYLQEVIESLLCQSYVNWECLIIDDGSIDNSLEVATLYQEQDCRIRLLRNEEGKKGAAAARNHGVKNARGKFVIFLDSDDLLSEFCIQQRVEIMEVEEELDFAVFPMFLFSKRPGDSNLLWNVETEEGDLNRFLKLDAVWQTTGPIWKRNELLKLPLFNEKLSCWQDVGFHINVLLKGCKYRKFYHLPPDCFYRKNATESISQQKLNTGKHLNSRKLLIDQIHNCIKDSSTYSSKVLFLNFHFSYLNTGRITSIPQHLIWFSTAYKPGIKEFLEVISLSLIKGLRFTKMVFLQNYYSSKVSALLPPSSIGQHSYDN